MDELFRAGTIHQSQVESLEYKYLTPQEAVNTLFWSFFFSQGDDFQHPRIFNFIATSHPEYRIREEDIPEYRSLAQTKIEEFVGTGPHTNHLTWDTMMKESQKRIEQFAQALNDRVAENSRYEMAPVSPPSLYEMLGAIVRLDRRFSGRTTFPFMPWQLRPWRTKHTKGPFAEELSQFVEYILLGTRPPGPPIYQEMMRDLKGEFVALQRAHAKGEYVATKWLSQKLEELLWWRIDKLVQRHNEKDPARPISPHTYLPSG